MTSGALSVDEDDHVRADQSVVLVCTEIPFLHRLDQLVTYAFQVCGSMGQQLVLPCRHLRRQLLVGDGVCSASGRKSGGLRW